jgi:hypothetical protein
VLQLLADTHHDIVVNSSSRLSLMLMKEVVTGVVHIPLRSQMADAVTMTRLQSQEQGPVSGVTSWRLSGSVLAQLVDGMIGKSIGALRKRA